MRKDSRYEAFRETMSWAVSGWDLHRGDASELHLFIDVVVFDAYVLVFRCWMLGFGGGDCAGIVDMEGGGDRGVEGAEVVEEVTQTVRVLRCVGGRYVRCFPHGGGYEFLAF